MKVFIQSIVAQILLNPYIFWRGYQAIPPKRVGGFLISCFLSLNYQSSFRIYVPQCIAGLCHDCHPIYL